MTNKQKFISALLFTMIFMWLLILSAFINEFQEKPKLTKDKIMIIHHDNGETDTCIIKDKNE